MNSNKYKNIYELFREKAKRRPDEIAVRDNNNQITYRNLNNSANRIARMLIDHKVLAGNIIAVDIRSPIEMAAGLMGIIKAGGVYMSLDAALPNNYIHYQLEQSKATFLLTHSRYDRYQNNLEFNGKILFVDRMGTEDFEENNKSSKNTYMVREEENPLAIIYSSHSSGKPQGITLSHRKIVDWIRFNSERLNVDFNSTLFISSLRMRVGFPIWLVNLVTETGGSVYFYDPEDQPGFPELKRVMRSIKFKSVVCSLDYLHALISNKEFKHFFPENITNIISVGEENFNIEEFKKFIKDK